MPVIGIAKNLVNSKGDLNLIQAGNDFKSGMRIDKGVKKFEMFFEIIQFSITSNKTIEEQINI